MAAHKAFRHHQYGSAALNLASALPVLGIVGRAARLGGLVQGGVRAENFIYSSRVLTKAARNVYHNFPHKLDPWILRGGKTTVQKEGYMQVVRRGVYRGRRGQFELGIRPSALAGPDRIVVVHRFFRPYK